MSIHILPEHVVRRIRAGEVVERPAAAIKELVENSLDAGATLISVEVSKDVRTRLSVDDNGSGMTLDDLILSTERHATSKLTGDYRLEDVETLGFRGEALAALSAVSRVTILTRTAGSDCGWWLNVGPEITKDYRPAARSSGTQVIIEGLFDAHPARAAFLKNERAELHAIRAIFEDAAMSRPDVAFTLTEGDKVWRSFKAETWRDRAIAIMGASFDSHSMAVSTAVNGIEIEGLVSIPAWKGHATAGQSFIVNGRPLKGDKVLSAAVKRAYAELSGVPAPAVILNLRLAGDEVDINVHPAKAEVRFRDSMIVQSGVQRAIDDVLSGSLHKPSTALAKLALEMARPLTIGEQGPREHLPLGRAIGAVLGGYFLSETEGGLVIVDAHAAAERALYEQLMASVRSHGVPAKKLRTPIIVEVGAPAVALFDEREEVLARFGLETQAIDRTSIIVNAIPEPFKDAQAVQIIEDVSAALMADPYGDPVMDLIGKLCASLACHSAHRFGDAVDLETMDSMLRDFERSPHISTCMHGRPTFVKLSKENVAEIFRRHS